jgi:hypothetical protein
MKLGKDTTLLPLERQRADRMDSLTAFGLFAVTAMLVTYALEDRTSWFILAFAGACALGSAYGFLQGAWPFGLIEAIWAVVALRRWWLKMNRG